ncbi:MAG: L-ribulose-5-phosphate 3-epimerase [Planctomycetota bacterium]|jgi:L-ribulose-5-phosphate 3-epimerase
MLPKVAAVAAAPRAQHPILLSCKYGMVAIKGSMIDKFQMLARLGYDGVELDSPAGYSADEVKAAQDASGLPVHGVVDSVHWSKRLSSPDEAVRDEGIAALEGAIRDAKAFGGSSVLLVPGRVADPKTENHDHVWQRSITGIRQVLPLAAKLGIHILIENVWNGFCYDHEGAADQSAERFAAYIDEIGSPWVGMYHDLGNHRKYGKVEEWVRTLGHRIVKVDVKGWGFDNGWCKIGEGSVDWPEVRKALREVNFTGWATAEVGGGAEEWLGEVKERMERVLRSD